jgi:hypothetical protein
MPSIVARVYLKNVFIEKKYVQIYPENRLGGQILDRRENRTDCQRMKHLNGMPDGMYIHAGKE